jgi:hypothetical protein
MDRDVIVEGVVHVAEWSRSGKVMNIEFRGATENGLLVVLFERNRKRFDEAFAGDLGANITGARVRIRGTVQPYGGRVESMKGRPQIILDYPQQLSNMELAPSTKPSSDAGKTG